MAAFRFCGTAVVRRDRGREVLRLLGFRLLFFGSSLPKPGRRLHGLEAAGGGADLSP